MCMKCARKKCNVRESKRCRLLLQWRVACTTCGEAVVDATLVRRTAACPRCTSRNVERAARRTGVTATTCPRLVSLTPHVLATTQALFLAIVNKQTNCMNEQGNHGCQTSPPVLYHVTESLWAYTRRPCQHRASVLFLLELLFVRERVLSCPLLSADDIDMFVNFIRISWCE